MGAPFFLLTSTGFRAPLGELMRKRLAAAVWNAPGNIFPADAAKDSKKG